MKKIIIALTGCLLGVSAFISCDSVSEPDRFIPAEIVPQRAVLLEEFTGQNCTNCPDGHKAVSEITASLGDSVVAVGIHASNLALVAPLGLKVDAGETYYKAVGSPALPTAVINMQTSPLQVSEWGASINHLIMTKTPFTVVAHSEVADGKLDVKVAYSSGEDYEGKLLVWVVENGIIARQIDHGTLIPDYEHNHVFRGTVNGQWGEDVTLKAHVAQNKEYAVELDEDWNPANIYVVAFLYNDAGVAQVTQSLKH